MLSSALWFAAGACCAWVVMRARPRRQARRRAGTDTAAPARTRRAWLERDAALLPDPEFIARLAQIEAELAHEHLTGERRPRVTRRPKERAQGALAPIVKMRMRD